MDKPDLPVRVRMHMGWHMVELWHAIEGWHPHKACSTDAEAQAVYNRLANRIKEQDRGRDHQSRD